MHLMEQPTQHQMHGPSTRPAHIVWRTIMSFSTITINSQHPSLSMELDRGNIWLVDKVHRIVLGLLPPHSSHLLQPLDVGIFAPLKMAISQRQTHLYRTGFRHIQKAEWLEHYIKARHVAITEKNVLSAWRGAGLFPENMF
jgi:DDE superfamily endonuclease